MNLSKQLLSLMIDLIWLQVNLSEPGADELLHFSSVSINSCLENKFYSFTSFLGISSRTWISISCIWAELKELYRAFQRSSSSIHRRPSYWIASIAGSLHFLTQCHIQVHLSGNNVPTVKPPPNHTSLPSMAATLLATRLMVVLQPSGYSIFHGGDTPIQLSLPWQSYSCQCLNTETPSIS